MSLNRPLHAGAALVFAVLLASATIAAAAQQNPTAPAAAPQTAPPPAPQQVATRAADGVYVPQPAERHPRYRVQRSDVLVLTFPLTPEFNQKVMVQPDGYISLQGADSICVLGLTVPEVNEAIKKAYARVLHEPVLQVDLTEFQKPFFIVTGQVNKPGQYDLRSNITVAEAIGIAGGFMPTAKTQVYLYHRDSTGWVEAKELKLKDFLHGKNVSEDADMRPGDMIFVPEKTITKVRKYIPYSVGTSIYGAAY
jgi:protein involved in polysaccharide export with SLBB domain